MAKKIANKTENAALQGATVLAAQTVAVSPLAVQPAVAAAAVELQKAKKKAVDADQEQQATVVDLEVLSDLVADQGAVQGADIVLAQASGSGSGGAAGGAAGAAAGVSTTALVVGGLAVAAAAGGSSSSSPAVAATSAPATSAPATSAPAPVAMTTATTDKFVGTSQNDSFTALVATTGTTFNTGDLIADISSSDADTLTITARDDITGKPTISGIEKIIVNVDAVTTPAASATVLNFATDSISAGTTFEINNTGADSAVKSVTMTALANNQTIITSSAFDKTITLDTAAVTSSLTLDVKGVGTSGSFVVVDLDTAASLNNTITAAGYVDVDTTASSSVKVTAVNDIKVDATEAAVVNLTSTAGNVEVVNADEALFLKISAAAGDVTVASIDLAETIDIVAGKTITLASNMAATSASFSAKGTSTITDDSNTLLEVTLSGNAGAATFDMDAGADNLKAVKINGSQDVTVIVSATSIEALSGANDLFKVTDSSTGVSTLELTGDGSVDLSTSTVDLVKVSSDLNAETLTVVSGQAVKVKVSQTALTLDGITSSGSTNTATLTLDDANRSNGAAVGFTTLTVTDIKTLTIDASVDTTSTGVGQTYSIATLTASDENSNVTINQGVNKLSSATMLDVGTGTVTVTGSGTVNVAGVTATTFDASAVTGIVTFTSIDGDEIANVKTGSAADVLTIDDEGTLVVESGAGNDTLTISGALDWYAASKNLTIDMGDGTSDVLVLDTDATVLKQATGKTVTINGVEQLDYAEDFSISASTISGKTWLLEETGDDATAVITVVVSSTTTSVDLSGLGYQTGKAGSLDDDTFVIDAHANTSNITIKGALVSQNTITGGSGVNTMTGGDYDDTIVSGNILDVLTGGDGADTFDLDGLEGGGTSTDYVTINDYEVVDGGGDAVDLIGLDFGAAAVAVTGDMGGLWTVTNGIATKAGATVSSFLTAAAEYLNADGGDEFVVAFVSGGNTWIYSSGALDDTTSDDVVVKLEGVVLTGLELTAGTTANYGVIV